MLFDGAIIAYNIFLITISDSVDKVDKATEISVLNIERPWHNYNCLSRGRVPDSSKNWLHHDTMQI